VDTLSLPEKHFPLKVSVCNKCWLVQTEDYADRSELFNKDYAYFSSTSKSWVEHARHYVNNIVEKIQITRDSYVVEIASNDGYLLEFFLKKGIPCLGIEPTDSTADIAEKKGISVLRKFFGLELAKQLNSQNRTADLIIGNNVFAHVPNINDFTRGLKCLLKHGGTITLEFPHLLNLIKHSQFDTIYHEHFSYLSLGVVIKIFESCDLRIFDVEKISTHGGSLRIYAAHADDPRQTNKRVTDLLLEEHIQGLNCKKTYDSFQNSIDIVKNNALDFLISQKNQGKSVAGYGAAAKGSTLLNYAGIKPDLLPYICDAAESKIGKYMPGSRIPILSPTLLFEKNPDYLVIFPWNIAEEVIFANEQLRTLGTQFVIFVPSLKYL
jgi:SAM-dependent methyltransferase